MIRAIVWKEWREQRIVVLAVLSFGALALYLTAQFADPSQAGAPMDGGGARELMAVALAYLSGAVSGAILLADEKEVGTLEFLDTLPCHRRTVWIGKAIAGFVLAVGQCTVLSIMAVAFGSVDERVLPWIYGVIVILIGLLAFAWGMFGGALARSTLGAVFQGSIWSVVAGVVLSVPFIGWAGARAVGRLNGLPIMAFYVIWVAVGLLGSAFLFTGQDRRRVARPLRRGAASNAPRKPRFATLRALGWLTARQGVFVMLGAGAAGLLVGAIMLIPESQPLFVWPGATLALGVLAGVTTVGEEQVRGVARFWAERRLPLGRLWLVKTGSHFAIAAGAALLLFLLIFAGSPTLLFRTRLVAELRPELWRFLLLGLVYGFTVGHLAGMLFRKTIVAGLVATVTAATMAGLILPSIVGGGAAAWQVWGPAVVLLVTARLLLYPWATDRVGHRGPVLRAVGGGLLAFGILGVGIGYRVVEVPDAPDRLADSGFASSLPVKDGNDPGRVAKSAASQYRRAALDAKNLYPGLASGPVLVRRGGALADAGDPLTRAARIGWTSEAESLGPWLDLVFKADWVKGLEELSDLPIGVFEDPRDLDYFSPLESVRELREMAFALRVRGMQRQVAGDAETFPRLLRGGLAAARSARNRGGLACLDAAFEAEEVLLGGLSEWIDRLVGRPDLLRCLQTDLDRHEGEMPVGGTDTFWAEQIVLRNTLDRIGTWLPTHLGAKPGALEAQSLQFDAESNLIAFAWTVPWERARRERLLRVQTVRAVDPRWLSGLHRPTFWRFERTESVAARDRRGQVVRRFARLEVALRLYQLDRGAQAPDLSALVPRYLSSILEDPYTGRPLGYRVSPGELISTGHSVMSQDDFVRSGVVASLANPVGGLNGLWVAFRTSIPPRRGPAIRNISSVEQFLAVPPGYAVLWSAGPDGQDDGGRRTGMRGIATNPGEDWVILIPPVGAAWE